MTTKGTLVLMRHAETPDNEGGVISGHQDPAINGHGKHQTRAAGAIVSKISFDFACSSHRRRAVDTIERTLESSGTHEHLQNSDGSWQVEIFPEIDEADAGEFAGRSMHADPEVSAFDWIYDVPMPGGESGKDVVERVQKIYDEEILPRLARGENVFVGCHFGTIQAFQIVMGIVETPAAGALLPDVDIPNAAPLICKYEDGVLVSHRLVRNPAVKQAASQSKPSGGRSAPGPSV